MELEEYHNFFHKIQYKFLANILDSDDIQWKYLSKPSLGNEQHKNYYENSTVVCDSPVFTHFFYRQEFSQKTQNSKVYDLFYNKLKSIYLSDIKIIRIRANMNIPCPNYRHLYGAPHVDWEEFEHKTLIYYLNTTDGDTILFDEKFPKYKENEVSTIFKNISPVENKAIVFDGYRYHAAVPSITNIRKVINVNFICKDT